MRRIPPVRRARDYHIYDESGRRYLDFYQDGGRAVLGHRPPNVAKTLKNVLAIAAGIADGLGFGANARAALITRGLAEITRLGVAMGGRPETFAGLAGLGDLVTTCFSPIGRNRSAGQEFGRGKRLDEVTAATRSVIEGIATTRSVLALARRANVEMPITQAMTAILGGRIAPEEALKMLMTRQLKVETQL